MAIVEAHVIYDNGEGATFTGSPLDLSTIPTTAPALTPAAPVAEEPANEEVHDETSSSELSAA
jgi:hypothetical protein